VNVLDGPPVPIVTGTGAEHAVVHVHPGSSQRIGRVDLPA